MRIISIKNGFTADHSSTPYEFLAVDKPLSKNQRSEVASLSRRADPTSRRVSFVYHVDGYDIPGGWEKLMKNYYDVMHREDYDWWTLAVAFKISENQKDEIIKYAFRGIEDLGVDVEFYGDRAVVSIFCRIDYANVDEGYEDDYEDEEYEDKDETEGESNGVKFASDNELLNLLVNVREQLILGDYRRPYAVYEKYGYQEDEEEDVEKPPVPKEKKSGGSVIEAFKDLLVIDF